MAEAVAIFAAGYFTSWLVRDLRRFWRVRRLSYDEGELTRRMEDAGEAVQAMKLRRWRHDFLAWPPSEGNPRP